MPLCVILYFGHETAVGEQIASWIRHRSRVQGSSFWLTTTIKSSYSWAFAGHGVCGRSERISRSGLTQDIKIVCILLWHSTSMDSITADRPCVCILWRGGCVMSGVCDMAFLFAAHWSKYHCYKQAPSRYDLRCLKETLNTNKQT